MLKLLRCAILASRPKGWRAYMWMGVLGLLQGKPSFQAAAVAIYSLASYLATAFAVNNFFDEKSDALNPRKDNPFVRGCDKSAVHLVAANQAVALLLVAACAPTLSLAAYLAAVLLVVAYSAPPFRLKSVAGLDVLSHVFYFGVLPFYFGAALSGAGASPTAFYAALILGTYSAFLQLRNLKEDRSCDKIAGDRTLFVKRPSLSQALLYASGTFSAAGAALLSPLSAALAFPASLLLGWKRGWERFVDSLVAVSLSLPAVTALCGFY